MKTLSKKVDGYISIKGGATAPSLGSYSNKFENIIANLKRNIFLFVFEIKLSLCVKNGENFSEDLFFRAHSVIFFSLSNCFALLRLWMGAPAASM